jgi:hypothetical protein
MNKKILEYIKKSSTSAENRSIGEISVQGVGIYIKEPLPENIDMRHCFSYILEKMPKIFYGNIDKIVIGQFSFLKKREVDAIYKDRTIYITNNQETNESLMADIIHEIAHAFEDSRRQEIYGDRSIENEFVSKRMALFRILQENNLLTEPITEEDFYETKYDEKFDNYLYKVIGYNKLGGLSKDIFISPYSCTCLREYFANAFEIFFVKDLFIVKKYTPSIYSKLVQYLEF